MSELVHGQSSLAAGCAVLGRERFSLLERVPYRLAFLTVSGAHLYGFPSADSDFDLRGMHVTPLARVLSLFPFRETWEDQGELDGPLDEIVTHDARKYFRLLLNNNGYVLEQVFSSLVVIEGVLPELRAIAKRCVTRLHYRHYLGFSDGEWRKFANRPDKTVKRLLYAFRVVLTGIHLMKTGEVEANVERLNDAAKLPYLDELVAAKQSGTEFGSLPAGHGYDFYQREFVRLVRSLEETGRASILRTEPEDSAKGELDDLLLRLRLQAK
jgi:predicted nucleotidyltransferase